MNYTIISDEKKFKEFIDWLPDLGKHERYVVCLFARRKYCREVVKMQDSAQLARFSASKESLFDKVKQLECEIGSYKMRGGNPVPQEGLVLYITPNPRDLKGAAHKSLDKIMSMVKEGDNSKYKIEDAVLSSLQNTKSRSGSWVCDFDIDSKEVDLKELNRFLPENAYRVVETRGGYHVLVLLNKAPKTKWYVAMKNKFDVDTSSDMLLPVPGCIQGGFTPVLL